MLKYLTVIFIVLAGPVMAQGAGFHVGPFHGGIGVGGWHGGGGWDRDPWHRGGGDWDHGWHRGWGGGGWQAPVTNYGACWWWDGFQWQRRC